MVLIRSTFDSDVQQEKPSFPTPLTQGLKAPRPMLFDFPTRCNMLPNASTTSPIQLAPTVLPTEHDIANDGSHGSPSNCSLRRRQPYLDDVRTIVNSHFHGRWQRPLMGADPDTHPACNSFPLQPKKKSKFFADGHLIGHDSIPAFQQPVTEAPVLTDNNAAALIDSSAPIPPEDCSRSPFTDLHDRLETKRAWNTDFTSGAQVPNLVTADISSLDTVTLPDRYDCGKSQQRMSPLPEPRPVDLDPIKQNYRRPILSTVCHLETDIGESMSDPDAAEYDMISPVSSQDTWVELSNPAQCSFDMASSSDDENDEENDESYCGSYQAETSTACTNDNQWKHDGADTSAIEWPTVQEAMKLEHTRSGGSPGSTMDDDDDPNYWDGVTDWFM
ncbi:hypothetical protein AG0111_0g6069 [Alternaria gaisen]|uniref:Uncharacterized protein n=1 Tax=Alternaria gaisen TaxID=167740 RepID=A0ACB6FMP8_9PLEO|nr:hypothetical protein AG0111_0g6069 [Alternaria gaisen]